MWRFTDLGSAHNDMDIMLCMNVFAMAALQPQTGFLHKRFLFL